MGSCCCCCISSCCCILSCCCISSCCCRCCCCSVFVSTKFHFDETISLAGLVSSFVVRRRCATFIETLRWDNFCNFGATHLGFGTLFTNIILLWIRNSEKIGPPQPPQKTKKPQKKTYGFSRWDILPMLIARRLGFGTVFTNIILLWIRNFEKNRTTQPPKKKKKKKKKAPPPPKKKKKKKKK